MPIRSRLASLWRNLFYKARVEQELDEEVRACLETPVLISTFLFGASATDPSTPASVSIDRHQMRVIPSRARGQVRERMMKSI